MPKPVKDENQAKKIAKRFKDRSDFVIINEDGQAFFFASEEAMNADDKVKGKKYKIKNKENE